ncbi:MAG TPA: hypothetical protein VJL35_16790 [Gemmatimonadaceae bacterium]|nr:hypothetical protein [Gemmatimonadaceae bacterium]
MPRWATRSSKRFGDLRLYSTCIFCNSNLGRNEAIEHFPVGRRLAFDSSKGRLWAVCGKCGRWNLTPLEERWEAIEECEKEFRGTILRSSTDQIGLARIKEGTDLIRIGQPLRPEFAAWRYGRYLAHRRKMMYAAIGVTAAATVGVSLAAGTMIGAAVPTYSVLFRFLTRTHGVGKARKKIRQIASEHLAQNVRDDQKVYVRVISSTYEPHWALSLSLDGRHKNYHGSEALHLAHLIAPALNEHGAGAGSVKEAVQEIEDAGSPERYFLRARDFGSKPGYRYSDIRGFPAHLRLAFEMAAHEESERVAMEGELAQLEADWREAEEVASIADNMFVPRAVSDFIQRHRAKT